MWPKRGNMPLRAPKGNAKVALMSDQANASACWICDKIALPQERVIDALGYPVHKSCYAELLREEENRRKSNNNHQRKALAASIWSKLRKNGSRSPKSRGF